MKQYTLITIATILSLLFIITSVLLICSLHMSGPRYITLDLILLLLLCLYIYIARVFINPK